MIMHGLTPYYFPGHGWTPSIVNLDACDSIEKAELDLYINYSYGTKQLFSEIFQRIYLSECNGL